VVDFLMIEGRFQEAIEVAEVILQPYSRDGYTTVKLGTAYAELMRVEFLERFPTLATIPPALRQRYMMLAQQNQLAFEAAEALGWEPPRQGESARRGRLPILHAGRGLSFVPGNATWPSWKTGPPARSSSSRPA
jgi:hypothetical protein